MGSSAYLRPQQFAWAMRRTHAGGHVFCLLKNGDKWSLYQPAYARLEQTGKGLRIVSSPEFSGDSWDSLQQTLWTLSQIN